MANRRDMCVAVVASTARLSDAWLLWYVSGQSATQVSNRPLTLRNSMKTGNWPSGVTAAAGSHSTWIRPPNVSSAIAPFGPATALRGDSPMG